MKRTFAFSLITVMIIIGGWYLSLGRSAIAQLLLVESDSDAEKRKLKTYQETLARFDERIKEYNHLYATFDSIPVLFSGKDEVTALYQILDSLCHLPGYQLEEITPSLQEVVRFLQEWAQADTTITIPIRIKIKGDYQSLAELIKAVEKSRYFNRLVYGRLYGSEELNPYCALDMTFVAGLSNRLEMFDFE